MGDTIINFKLINGETKTWYLDLPKATVLDKILNGEKQWFGINDDYINLNNVISFNLSKEK